MHHVPFDLLTKQSNVFQVWTADASDLGWAPGEWPQLIWAKSPNGHGAEFTCVKVELDGTHVYTSTECSATIRIFND